MSEGDYRKTHTSTFVSLVNGDDAGRDAVRARDVSDSKVLF